MLRTIYHGSSERVAIPRYGVGKSYNDYGCGFYCTKDKNLASEWAAGKGPEGWVNMYQIDDSSLRILNLTASNYCILHWLGILLRFRTFDLPYGLAKTAQEYILTHFHIDLDAFDIIYGYRADDSYFSFARDFLNGSISYQQLAISMKLGYLGCQYVLRSQLSYEKLAFIKAESIDFSVWYLLREHRENHARKHYFELIQNHHAPTSLYITQIINEEMTSNDARLF